MCIIIYNVYFYYVLEKKYAILTSGPCQTSLRYDT